MWEKTASTLRGGRPGTTLPSQPPGETSVPTPRFTRHRGHPFTSLLQALAPVLAWLMLASSRLCIYSLEPSFKALLRCHLHKQVLTCFLAGNNFFHLGASSAICASLIASLISTFNFTAFHLCLISPKGRELPESKGEVGSLASPVPDMGPAHKFV